MKSISRTSLAILAATAVILLSGISPAASASGWRCACGCDDPLCINIDGECYAERKTYAFYTTGEQNYEDIDNENGQIVHADDGLHVKNTNKNHSWGYSFDIPDEMKHRTKWRAELEILSVRGAAQPGITLENGDIGVSFNLSRYGRGELVLIHTNQSTTTIDVFDIPKAEFPKRIGLDYDANTSILNATIEGETVKTVRLPHFGIPAISSVTGVSMQTMNTYDTSMGDVVYGGLHITAEN